MSSYLAVGLGILSSILEMAILVRALKGRFALRFPFFYSYLTYVFLGSALIYYVVRPFWPPYYRNVFWFYFLITLLAEFAVLLEVSDHIFAPYPYVRSIGRWVTIALSVGFFLAYIRPVLTGSEPTSLLITELVKRSSVTKAAVIVGLLLSVRLFGLPLNTNTSGLMTGLSVYFGSNIINFELLARLGPLQYGRIFVAVGPISYTLCLLVWTVALWRYEPAFVAGGRPGLSTLVPGLLGRFNSSLSRLLRK